MTLIVLVYKLTSSNRSPSMSERGVDVIIAIDKDKRIKRRNERGRQIWIHDG